MRDRHTTQDTDAHTYTDRQRNRGPSSCVSLAHREGGARTACRPLRGQGARGTLADLSSPSDPAAPADPGEK
eukprot:3500210-Rhodomonas_salina.2